MSHSLLINSTVHRLLFSIDCELADNLRKIGCSCGGVLHVSSYPRSPLGLPALFRPSYEMRFSFCCGTCRKRSTPPSVRFFGRRWYPAPLLVLISALMVSINDYRLRQIKRHFGVSVSESTWKRWRRWWRESFVKTRFWSAFHGLIPEAKWEGNLLRRMLHTMKGGLHQQIILLLRFLSPMTAGFLRAV